MWTDANAETPVLWPPHANSWLIGKDFDAGRDWGQENKVMTEDEMAGWHHRLDGHESEWTPRVGYRQGGLACCDSWGRKESDTTERVNWTELILYGTTFLPSHCYAWNSQRGKVVLKKPHASTHTRYCAAFCFVLFSLQKPSYFLKQLKDINLYV